jgi:hypothetical protein
MNPIHSAGLPILSRGIGHLRRGRAAAALDVATER